MDEMMHLPRGARTYADLMDGFRWEVPRQFNIAEAVCGRHARRRELFALYFEDEDGTRQSYSFWDIQREANRLANALRALGVGPGDRVAIILPQRPETAIAHVACYQMGAMALPLSHLFGPDAVAFRLEDAAAVAAIVDPDTMHALATARPDRLREPGHPRRPKPSRIGDRRQRFQFGFTSFDFRCQAGIGAAAIVHLIGAHRGKAGSRQQHFRADTQAGQEEEQ